MSEYHVQKSVTRKLLEKLQDQLSDLAIRLLTVEGEMAGVQRLTGLISRLQGALLDLAPRVALLEHELRRLKGRLDAWGTPPPTNGPPSDPPDAKRPSRRPTVVGSPPQRPSKRSTVADLPNPMLTYEDEKRTQQWIPVDAPPKKRDED